jgi:hypothetical protein
MEFIVQYDDSKMEGMKAFITDHIPAIDRAIKRAAVTGMDWIKRGTPLDMGAAQRSWEVKQVEELSWIIESVTGAGAVYTPFLEAGTFMYGPFHVAPKTMWTNKRIKGGMEGAHMVENNMDAISNEMEKEIQVEFDKANK